MPRNPMTAWRGGRPRPASQNAASAEGAAQAFELPRRETKVAGSLQRGLLQYHQFAGGNGSSSKP